MTKLNILIVYNQKEDKVLMYKDGKKFNILIGKIKQNEKNIEAAYRELQEKTGISEKDIILTPLLKCLPYKKNDIEWEFYGGKLNKKYEELLEEKKFYWIDINNDFSDKDKFAFPDNEHIELMIKQVGFLLKYKILEN